MRALKEDRDRDRSGRRAPADDRDLPSRPTIGGASGCTVECFLVGLRSPARHRPSPACPIASPPSARRPVAVGRGPVITASYPASCRKVVTIMKTVAVCPISGGELSSDDEFSAHMTVKSPSDENLT